MSTAVYILDHKSRASIFSERLKQGWEKGEKDRERAKMHKKQTISKRINENDT